MNFLKILVFLISLIFFGIASAQDRYIAKIAVVDIESVLENSLAITSIKKSVNVLSQNIQDDISKKEKAWGSIAGSRRALWYVPRTGLQVYLVF